VVAVVDRDGRVLYRAGPVDLGTFLRSSAKPFQTLPLVESGGADALGLTEAELAVTCGSHSGELAHIEAVRAILSKAHLDERALQCGAHAPLDPSSAQALIRDGRAPDPVHNNCSGKHAGMLAACRHREWPVDTYLRPDHPLQMDITGIIAACCGISTDAIPLGTDGCGVPTFYVTLHQAARAFAILADPSAIPQGRANAIRRAAAAMRRYPHMVGGTGRLNTDLLARFGDRLCCKTGAEGVFGIGLLNRGWGIAVKIEDGNPRALGPAVVEALYQLGVITGSESESLASLRRPIVHNHHGRGVGEMRPVFRLEKVS
jgi:L-asparaginase II